MAGKESDSLQEQLFPSSYTVLGAAYSRSGDSVKLSLSSEETLVLPADAYALSRLKEGSEISREELLTLKKDEAIFHAKRKALRLLERRALTAVQLKLKLAEAMVPKEIILDLLKELKERGLLNDQKYAEEWIASQLRRKPQGRRLLYVGLIRKGVPRPDAERLLAAAYPEEKEEEACQATMIKLAGRRGLDPSELLPALARRGFSPSLIKRVFARLKKNR
jgi:SOS response regulatory protein OraA/RecX